MHASPTKTSTHRARWAAIGAAVAVSLGAGGLGIVRAATNPAGASAYIPIDPCRLVDTRPGSGQVGPSATKIGPDGVLTIQGRLDTAPNPDVDVAGTCATKLPSNLTGLQLNVTGVNSNAPSGTFLTVYPEGVERPTASNVNVLGDKPIPNAVTVKVNPANGKFNVFNRFGTIDVVVDVVGFYADHTHDSASITNEAGIAYNAVTFDAGKVLSATDEYVIRTKINVPSDGYVVAHAELQWENGTNALDRARCQITKGDDVSISTTEPYLRLTDGGDTGTGLFYSDTHQRVLEVKEADDTGNLISGFGQNVNLVCDLSGGAVSIQYATLVLQFFPTDYTSQGLILIPFPLSVEDE